jgi:uncharacterized protein (TIGR02265 family)
MPRPPSPIEPEAVVRYARPPIPDSEKLVRLPLDLALRTAEAYLTPAIRAEARVEFADYLGRPQTPPLELNRMIDFLAARCLPTYPLDEARRWLGSQGLSLYVKTPLVQAIYFTLRKASIEWILRSFPRQFAMSQNYGTYEMVELEPRHWRFTLQDYPMYPSILHFYC